MCIISKQILLYGSDVQLYNENAFQNNIKSIYMYPAHIYTTQYKETKLHQSSRKNLVRQTCINSVPVWFHSRKQTWGQLLSNVIDYITITLQFS